MLTSWYPAHITHEEAPMAFAENIRRLRLERFLSQGDLARQAGMHPITLTRLETGSRAPTARSVRALAAALGVEPSELATPDEVVELRRVLVNAAMAERARRNQDRPPQETESPGEGRDHE
jgi:transcriptional regulator with XRE-family HTH domain